MKASQKLPEKNDVFLMFFGTDSLTKNVSFKACCFSFGHFTALQGIWRIIYCMCLFWTKYTSQCRRRLAMHLLVSNSPEAKSDPSLSKWQLCENLKAEQYSHRSITINKSDHSSSNFYTVLRLVFTVSAFQRFFPQASLTSKCSLPLINEITSFVRLRPRFNIQLGASWASGKSKLW